MVSPRRSWTRSEDFPELLQSLDGGCGEPELPLGEKLLPQAPVPERVQGQQVIFTHEAQVIHPAEATDHLQKEFVEEGDLLSRPEFGPGERPGCAGRP